MLILSPSHVTASSYPDSIPASFSAGITCTQLLEEMTFLLKNTEKIRAKWLCATVLLPAAKANNFSLQKLLWLACVLFLQVLHLLACFMSASAPGSPLLGKKHTRRHTLPVYTGTVPYIPFPVPSFFSGLSYIFVLNYPGYSLTLLVGIQQFLARKYFYIEQWLPMAAQVFFFLYKTTALQVEHLPRVVVTQ